MMILPLLLATLSISPTSSPSLAPSPTTTSEIQKFREVIQEKVKAKLQEMQKPSQTDIKRGYLGTITKIEDGKFYIDTKNKNHSISFTVDTVFLNVKSIKIKSTDLKVGQEVLVIGILDDQNNLIAKRIINTTPKSNINHKTIIYGQVVDISTMYSLLAMIPMSNKNNQYQIKTDTKNLQILSKTGENLTIKDLVKGKKIIVITISQPTNNQTLSVEKIIVL